MKQHTANVRTNCQEICEVKLRDAVGIELHLMVECDAQSSRGDAVMQHADGWEDAPDRSSIDA